MTGEQPENYDFKKEIFYVIERTNLQEFRNTFINGIIGDIND